MTDTAATEAVGFTDLGDGRICYVRLYITVYRVYRTLKAYMDYRGVWGQGLCKGLAFTDVQLFTVYHDEGPEDLHARYPGL